MNSIGKLIRGIGIAILALGVIGTIYFAVDSRDLIVFCAGILITLVSAVVPLGISEIIDLLEQQNSALRQSFQKGRTPAPPPASPSYFQQSSGGATQNNSSARRCTNCGLSLAQGVTVCPKCKHENF